MFNAVQLVVPDFYGSSSVVTDPFLRQFSYLYLNVDYLSTPENVAAVSALMLTPGYRSHRLLDWYCGRATVPNSLRRGCEFILALCQAFEASDSVEVDDSSELMLSYEFREEGPPIDPDAVPWRELFGGHGPCAVEKMSHPLRLFYIWDSYDGHYNPEERLWTVFRWRNQATKRVMHMLVSLKGRPQGEGEHHYTTSFYFMFPQTLEASCTDRWLEL